MSEEMTREEAISRIRNHKIVHKMNEPRAIYISEALDMAIKALEQEPSNDMVSRGVFEQVMWERDVAIEQLKDLGYGFAEKPKTGHWIDVNKGKWNTIPAYKCSACGANADLRDWSGKSPFCPWCGASMIEQESEEQACCTKK